MTAASELGLASLGAIGVALLGTLAAAVRFGWLTPWGALAGLCVGAAIAFGLGLLGVTLLLVFFVSSSLVTVFDRSGSALSAEGGQAEGSHPRTAAQVVGNAGIPAVAALMASLGSPEIAAVAAAGALAAANADTWASEIGGRVAGRTWKITTGERVLPGENGGVSIAGTVAGLAGGTAIGVVSGLVHDPSLWGPVTLAGVGGMVVDSLLGATLEGRVGWINNDIVNLACTLSGAIIAVLIA